LLFCYPTPRVKGRSYSERRDKTLHVDDDVDITQRPSRSLRATVHCLLPQCRLAFCRNTSLLHPQNAASGEALPVPAVVLADRVGVNLSVHPLWTSRSRVFHATFPTRVEFCVQQPVRPLTTFVHNVTVLQRTSESRFLHSVFVDAV
jgi:hypothetical protein